MMMAFINQVHVSGYWIFIPSMFGAIWIAVPTTVWPVMRV